MPIADLKPDDAPLHGYRGVSTPPPVLQRPQSFTVAISREAGARGSSIAIAVGELLGWQVFSHDMLDYLAHDESARAEFLKDTPLPAQQWAELEWSRLLRRRELIPASDTAAIARVIFTLAARGEVVLVGRGAGFLLPPQTTVHVRIVAPIEQRIAYLSQSLRLTELEAAVEAQNRDRRRDLFISSLTDLAIIDPTCYDLCVNSTRQGLQTTAELIAHVVRSKQIPDPSGSDIDLDTVS